MYAIVGASCDPEAAKIAPRGRRERLAKRPPRNPSPPSAPLPVPEADKGITRQALELPVNVAREFREKAAEGGRSVKSDGTAAIALLNSLPAYVAEPLLFWADSLVRRAPGKVKSEDAWRIVMAAIRRGPDVEAVSAEAVLGMLLDTERGPKDAPKDGKSADEEAMDR
jgi:hypothetical protein